VLRNPQAADHGGPSSPDAGPDFPCTDSGSHDATVRIHPHSGDWRAAVRAVKRAEDGDGVVVRLAEPHGVPVTLRLGGDVIGRRSVPAPGHAVRAGRLWA
jgi:hypothetical protein